MTNIAQGIPKTGGSNKKSSKPKQTSQGQSPSGQGSQAFDLGPISDFFLNILAASQQQNSNEDLLSSSLANTIQGVPLADPFANFFGKLMAAGGGRTPGQTGAVTGGAPGGQGGAPTSEPARGTVLPAQRFQLSPFDFLRDTLKLSERLPR